MTEPSSAPPAAASQSTPAQSERLSQRAAVAAPHACDEPQNHSGHALRLALVILSAFFFVELIGGLLTNSLALVSDAAHMLTDIAAIALALFAQWFATRPANARRSFGYRRVEILAAQINGFTLLAMAMFIVVEAYGRIKSPPPVQGLSMVVVASLGLLAQVAATLVLARARRASLNVHGAYLHAMTDAVQSVGVVGAGVLMVFTGWFIADPLISILIALLVAWSGGRILFEATHVLIEGTPRGLDLARVARLLEAQPAVERVTDLHAWSLTTGYNACSAHVVAAPDPRDAGHEELRRRLTRRLQEDFPLQHVTLQIEQECEHCRTSGCCDWLHGNVEATGGKGKEGS